MDGFGAILGRSGQTDRIPRLTGQCKGVYAHAKLRQLIIRRAGRQKGDGSVSTQRCSAHGTPATARHDCACQPTTDDTTALRAALEKSREWIFMQDLILLLTLSYNDEFSGFAVRK